MVLRKGLSSVSFEIGKTSFLLCDVYITACEESCSYLSD